MGSPSIWSSRPLKSEFRRGAGPACDWTTFLHLFPHPSVSGAWGPLPGPRKGALDTWPGSAPISLAGQGILPSLPPPDLLTTPSITPPQPRGCLARGPGSGGLGDRGRLSFLLLWSREQEFLSLSSGLKIQLPPLLLRPPLQTLPQPPPPRPPHPPPLPSPPPLAVPLRTLAVEAGGAVVGAPPQGPGRGLPVLPHPSSVSL